MHVEPGTRLGPYEITARLGSGGMGEVWKARDTRLDRSVAIKVLPEEFARNAQLKLRLEREARTISQLNHPNICTLHDVGDEYLVMELLDGETLADRLARGPLPMPDVLRYGIQIAEAVDRAHRAGIVHRDLKPGNIMLTKGGAKLLDFGLSRAAGIGLSTDGLTQHKPLTEEGTIVGTFQYMAPEQLEGLEPDARTDIFALGAVLYEMATGQRAFDGKTRTSLIASIVGGEPRPIRELQPVSPPAFEHVVHRALRKDRDERWQSAYDIASELRWIGEVGTPSAEATHAEGSRTKRGRLGWWVALALLLTTAAAAWLAYSRTPDVRTVYDVAVPPPRGGEFSFGSNLGWGVISPDGQQLVFRATTDDRTGLWVRSLDRDDARHLPGTERGFYPFWSPDSRWVGFFELGSMKKAEVSGGLPVVITTAAEWGRGASWGEDGWIVFCPYGGTSLMRVRAEGGEATAVTALEASRGENAHYWPTILPGGKAILYFVRSNSNDQEGVWFARLSDAGKSTDARRVIASSSSAVYARSSRGNGGHVLWVERGKLLARAFDPESGTVSGNTSEVTGRVRVHDSQRGAFLSASNDGTIAFSEPAVSPPRLMVLRRDGSAPEALALGGNDQYEPAFSPDAKMLAYVSVTGGTGQVWLYDFARKTTWPLTPGSGYRENLAWSPDGKEIAYADSVAPEMKTVRARVSGEGTKTQILTSPREERFGPVVWTAGGFIIGRLEKRDASAIVALPLAHPDKPIALTKSGRPNGNMAISPGDQWLAYGMEAGGRSDVFVARVITAGDSISLGEPQMLPLRDAESAVWTRGGKELIAWANDRFFYSIPIELEGDGIRLGTPVKLFRMSLEQANFNVTPDGERIVAKVNPDASSEIIRLLVGWESRLGK